MEPAHVADLGGKGHGDHKQCAAHGLICLHDRRHGPSRHDEREFLLETAPALEHVLDRVDAFLKTICCTTCSNF